MASSVLWWSALTVGTLVLTVCGSIGTTRTFRGRHVPRLGFFPPRHRRPPRWAMAGLFIGIFLASLAAGRLSETSGSSFAFFGGAVAVSLLVQTLVVWRHNQRVSRTHHDAVAEDTAGLRRE